MKLFNTTDINIVEKCQQSFSLRSPSDILPKRFDKLLDNITRGKVIKLSVVFLLFLFHLLLFLFLPLLGE